MDTLCHDLRYSFRILAKSPGFTSVAAIVLSLGIGANTAIFTVVKSVLLGPLPYKDADRLVTLWEDDTLEGNDRNPVAPANFGDWQKQNEVCSQLAYFSQPSGVNVTGETEPERITGMGVSQNLFALVGVQPILGRAFLPIDGKINDGSEVILSHGLWQRRFGGDRGAIGKPLMLDGSSFIIVGVMPPQFHLPEEAELWWQTLNGQLPIRGRYFLRVMGRLKPGVTIPHAQAHFTTIARRLEQQYQDTNKGRGIRIVSIRDELAGDARPTLLLLFGAVGFVLLIACANVANLLLVRTAGRRREMAVRAALGAGRYRLMRQSLTETLALAVIGGVSGLLLALWGVDMLARFSPPGILRSTDIKIDEGILAFTLAVTLLTAVICGSLPSWQVSRPDLNEALREGSRSSADAVSNRARGLLVVSEIAIALILLVGAGLMIKSFMRLMAIDPGLDATNVLTLQVSLSDIKYDKSEKIAAGYRRIIERIASVPGVRAVGAVSRMPLAGDRSTSGLTIEGRPFGAEERPEVHYRVVTPDYFRAMGIPLLKGRELTQRDLEGAPEVVLINQNMARRHWPIDDPVGKRIKLGPNPKSPWMSVVGVVGDARNFGLDFETRPEVYVSYLQSPEVRMRLAIRTGVEPLNLVAGVREALRSVDKDLPMSQVVTMEEFLSRSVEPRRLNMVLLGLFAGVALLLAAVGAYGVISFSVTQRTHEIGIRMALGARATDVVGLIIRQGMWLAAAGVMIGLAGSLALSQLMAKFLFDVSPADPVTLLLITLMLAVVALLTCWLPARRAAKLDPAVALRNQ